MPRSSITISPITSSATERVLEKGALKTGMPRAGGLEVHLVRADAEAPDRHEPVRRRPSPAPSRGCGSGCKHVDAAHGLDQRVLVESFGDGAVIVA
jgi:hypothetical protein